MCAVDVQVVEKGLFTAFKLGTLAIACASILLLEFYGLKRLMRYLQNEDRDDPPKGKTA